MIKFKIFEGNSRQPADILANRWVEKNKFHIVSYECKLSKGGDHLIFLAYEESSTNSINQEKIGNWQISSDGYYPYCEFCSYEPEHPEALPSICPQCGATLKEEDRLI